jgi:ArsR family transcriptional regulator, arsenate/arsenite/antimonite-responsive transcriptional repressor
MKQSNMVKIFNALSTEQRLKLFTMIYENQDRTLLKDDDKNCCCGLKKAFTKACSFLKISRSTVSHHLKELQNAGLINCRRDGQSFYCTVNEEAVKAIQNFLK